MASSVRDQSDSVLSARKENHSMKILTTRFAGSILAACDGRRDGAIVLR
jgi:hypothetical protein